VSRDDDVEPQGNEIETDIWRLPVITPRSRHGAPDDSIQMQAPFLERDWFKWFGSALGAAIAAGLGWVAVPNSMGPTDTSDAHYRLAFASILAATLWAYRLAEGAPMRPVRAAILLFSGTYLLGIVTILLCGAPIPPLNLGPGPGGPTEAAAYFEVLVPWIASGALLWTMLMLAIGPLAPIGRRLMRSQPPRLLAHWLPLVLAAVFAVGSIAMPGSNIRRIGWTVPDPPAARRPSVAGVVADSNDLKGSCRVVLTGGRTVELPGDICTVGSLYLGGNSAGLAWHEILDARFSPETPDPKCWGGEVWDWAWDRGDAVLFPYGLELTKAPGFKSYYPPTSYFGDLVYGGNVPCVSQEGQVQILYGTPYD
jgi:hypothetical protein